MTDTPRTEPSTARDLVADRYEVSITEAQAETRRMTDPTETDNRVERDMDAINEMVAPFGLAMEVVSCTCEALPGFGIDSAGCQMHGESAP